MAASVVVIGAGVIGASAAYYLARAGAAVTVVEAGEPAGETSSRSFAWLNSNDKPPPAYQRLNADGVEAHRHLRDALGVGPWLHESGHIRFVRTGAASDELQRRVDYLRSVDYPAEMIARRRAEEIEPRVRFAAAGAIAFFPREGWSHAPTLVRTLLDAATARGAQLITHRRVVAIDPDLTGVTLHLVPSDPARGRWPRQAAGDSPAEPSTPAVPTVQPEAARPTASAEAARLAEPPEAARTSDRLRADWVVIAAGRFADRVATLAGFRLDLTPTCGLLAVTAPVAAGPETVIHAPGVHFRPDGDGRLVLQDDETDNSVGPTSPEQPGLPGAAILLERARAYVPALAEVGIESVRVGIRPLPRDGLPVIGLAPGLARVYVISTHSGVTLGPLLGSIAAAEIVADARDPRLADFRPERTLQTR